MNISCPRCETLFFLSDTLYRTGRKARCSQCEHIFPMPEGLGESGTSSRNKPASSFSWLLVPVTVALVALLLLLCGYSGYLIYSAMQQPEALTQTTGGAGSAATESTTGARGNATASLVASLSLDEIRQFQVDNVSIGKIVVIQGFVVNSTDHDVDSISVEARLLDSQKRLLMPMRQTCGVSLTLFQLQTLARKDLREILANPPSSQEHNAGIPPNGRIPFVVVFPNPPAGIKNFEVQVVDARWVSTS